jgi:hypothetical protein
MRQGCTTRVLEQVFFDIVNDVHVLRPSLAEVAAWLCSGTERWNADFRSWVLDAAPQIHLEHGDAAALPLEYRRELLLSWVKRNEGRQRVWVSSSPDALRRLAAPELAEDVSRFLLDRSISIDIREELAMLVRFGRLATGVPSLLEIVRSTSESDRLKRYAVQALRDMAPRDSRRELWAIVQTWTTISAGLCGDIIEALFPEIIGPEDVCGLLGRVSEEEGELRSLTWSLGRHLDDCLTAEQAGPLLDGMNDLVKRPNFDWLLETLAKVLVRHLDADGLSPEQSAVAADGLFTLGKEYDRGRRDDEEHKKLEVASRRHAAVRQALFWRLVDDSQIKENIPWHIWFHSYQVLSFDSDDLEWLISEVESRGDLIERQVALRMALQVCRWKKMSRTQRGRLKKAVNGIPELERMLREHRAGWRFSLIRSWLSRYRDTPWRFRVKRWQYKLSAKYTLLRETWGLWRHRRKLRDGSAVLWLHELCHEARDQMHRWAPQCWEQMRSKRGAGVTAAVQAGCQLAWRKFTPDLPHEKPVPHQTDGRIIIGLAAADVIASEGNGLEVMSAEDAKLATRYAVNELNGLPEWLTRLASSHPAAVGEVLKECVAGEWNYAADRAHAYDVLADLAWVGGPLVALVEEKLCELLQAGDPTNVDILTFGLSALLKSESARARLGPLASDRCRTLAIDDPRFVWWMAVALQVNALEAIGILRERIQGSERAGNIVVGICALLENRGRVKLPQIAKPDYLAPAALRQLIPLVHMHVRKRDDIDRMGAYTPTERDEAQDFRNGLLSRLAESADPQASASLGELLRESALATDHDWIRHLLDQRRRADVEREPWKPADIRSFEREYETDPKTDRDLFDIALNRLSDIQHAVEASDNSLRGEIRDKADERELRNWLARKLVERSRQRYTVPQEEEIDRQQRPDLRIENPKTPPVSIEVKWADKWSLRELLSGLESQLVGQYLRAHNSRCGVYFLATDGRKQHWETPDGRRLTFAELVNVLRTRAAQIETENPGVDAVRVVAIDFRVPGRD